MMFRFSLVALALAFAAFDSEAGPFRRRAQPTYQYPSYQYPTYEQPVVVSTIESTSYYSPFAAAGSATEASATGGDGLDEVNAKRAARGLRPFIRDDSLTQAAQACAAFRARHGLFGHTSNDFTFVPSGSSAASAGCAAYPASYGWMSCCTYENYTYAGAAWVMGSDGKRYMHLFVR